ncbi:hypothetical protein PPERSA_04860 [Pseudocohnilembus persalinus]|uniref:Uncharacterized protein n=1 Tax=Pseudocohnilembus persalinus TaxID=266149 RepID=A0A0V0QJ50_PSEPJ|nr:hypothetical protein PPERSA_04860 [Pseudocohnilembus persalinus]|eukprot:KRX02238.1 hypothetical protein PPERSA_04860 [Pseudocohnilembus persalinus]
MIIHYLIINFIIFFIFLKVMEDIASNLLDIFTKNQNPAFNRAEYKIRFQLADIYINVKGEFDQGIKYLIDADQQSDRLGQNMEESEKKELTYEVIANITNQYFENGKSEYVREWIKKQVKIQLIM